MDSDQAAPVGRFPMRFLTAAVILTGIALLWLSWGTYSSYQTAQTASQRNFRTEQLRGTIVHLDEVLTMSARMAATTGDVAWEERYRRYEPQLARAITAAIAAAPHAYQDGTAAKTDSANRRLVEMENAAFALARQGRSKEAQSLLFSNEYEAQKQIYADGMKQFADALAAFSRAALYAEQRKAWWNITLAIVVTAILLVGWLFVLRTMRDWRSTLRRAHDELETRVQQRTAELATANEKLTQGIAERNQAEKDLAYERFLFATLMDHAPVYIYFKNAASQFIRLSKAMADYFGLDDPACAIGKTDLDLYDAQRTEQYLADERKVMTTGKPLMDQEEEQIWPDGRVRWVLTSKVPLHGADGKVIGTFGISRDITDRKRAESALRASEMKFRTLYDSSRDAIMLLTPEEGFLGGNPAAIKLFGCKDEAEFASHSPADFSPALQPDGTPSAAKAQQMMAIAAVQGSHFFEWDAPPHRRPRSSLPSVLLTQMDLEGQELLAGHRPRHHGPEARRRGPPRRQGSGRSGQPGQERLSWPT